MVSENISKIIELKKKELLLNEKLKNIFERKLISKVELLETPLGTKILIYCARPRLVLGKANENVKLIEKIAKEEFGIENPIVEAIGIENPLLDPEIVADYIAGKIEQYGNKAIRKIMVRVAEQVMKAGAIGIEIRITGKIIGDRTTTVRYQLGKMKKSGEINKICRTSIKHAKLPSGVIGVQVKIIPPTVELPDEIKIKEIQEIDINALEKIDPSLLEKIKSQS